MGISSCRCPVDEHSGGGGEGGGKIVSRSLCSEMLACLPCISGLFWLC